MTGYLKTFGLALAAILFSVVFVSGALGKAIAAVTLWCAEQPAWVWVAVLAIVTVGLYFKDRK